MMVVPMVLLIINRIRQLASWLALIFLSMSLSFCKHCAHLLLLLRENFFSLLFELDFVGDVIQKFICLIHVMLFKSINSTPAQG